MEFDCGMKKRGENVSGSHSIKEGAAKIIFSQQLGPSREPTDQCMVVDLLNSGGSKKKTFGGHEFSRCHGCGRDTAVIIVLKESLPPNLQPPRQE